MKRGTGRGWGPLFDWILGAKPEAPPIPTAPAAATSIATSGDPQTPEDKLRACRIILDGHGLAEWKLRVGRATRQLGSCVYRSKTIVLSRHLVNENDWPEIRDTVLHEIAHALVGPRHGHDQVWKNKARQLGAKPRASAPCGAVRMPEPKWEIWCPTCRKAVGKRYRRPPRWRRGYVHDVCRRRVQFRRLSA